MISASEPGEVGEEADVVDTRENGEKGVAPLTMGIE
jgi:hypothetical protein